MDPPKAPADDESVPADARKLPVSNRGCRGLLLSHYGKQVGKGCREPVGFRGGADGVGKATETRNDKDR